MTKEQEQQLKTIRAMQKKRFNDLARFANKYVVGIQTLYDIDFLLNLVDSQIAELPAQRLVDLVRYCRHQLHDEKLITDEEFAALVSVGAEAARRLEDYDKAIQNVATSMRSACIEKVKKLPTDYRDDRRPAMTADAFKRLAIKELESTSIQEQEKQS